VESCVADAPYVVRPINDQVMIRRTPDRQVGRILIPDSADTKPRIGIVEAVGPGRLLKSGKRAPMSVAVGDRVRYNSEAKGFVLSLPGCHPLDTRLLIPESGIEAVLEADAEASALGSPWPEYIVEGVQGGE